MTGPHNYKHVQPYAVPVTTEKVCDYGCMLTGKFKFKNGKICCSERYNRCSGKRNNFSELDHTERTKNSLDTRIKLGVTKSSRKKAKATMIANNTFEDQAKKMRLAWAKKPWNNNLQCPLIPYRNSSLVYQGTYELTFLDDLATRFGEQWVFDNVSRGPSLYYFDPSTQNTRLYISDFIIGNTIYEIKSQWTWNKKGADINLENTNTAKLTAAKAQGYNVVLVLDKQNKII